MTTRYFEEFPRIAYSLDNNETEQIVTDLLRRATLTLDLKNNVSFFETIEINNQTPEQLSYDVYGTTKLHWLILLVNERINPRFNWPLPEQKLMDHVSNKYGGTRSIFTRNRGLNKKGFQVETFFILAENSEHKNPTRLVAEFENDPDRTNQPISYQESEEIFEYETNFQIEENKNESYRNIFVLKPSIVNEIVSSYFEVINI